MRAIVFFLITTALLFSEEFPKIFSSAGDEIYRDMGKYLKIKDLDIYADKPELLESFCKDANASMQRGYSLDKAQEDPEATIDKEMIKSYARELRRLSNQNEGIKYQLQGDIAELYEKKDFTSLAVIREADIKLSDEIDQAIDAHEKKLKQEKALAIVIAKSKEAEKLKAIDAAKSEVVPKTEVTTVALASAPEKVEVTSSVKEDEQSNKAPTPEPEEENVPVQVALIKTPISVDDKTVPDEIPAAPEKKRVLTKLEYYEENIIHLKKELYELRESEDQAKMACLNDITAINYWMIKLLQNEKDPCMARDAIKQMKSYDKSSLNSCGRDSIRYTEWHGRIKPYVGTTLFKAEAACSR